MLTRGSIALMTVAMLTFASPAFAGDLKPQYVPADAKWLLHVDGDELADLKLVDELREMMPKISRGIRDYFQNKFGIDPSEDMQSITMFGRDYKPHSGTVVIRTEYDADLVEAQLRKQEQLKKTQWKEKTLFTVTMSKRDSHRDKYSDNKYSDNKYANGQSSSKDYKATVYLGDNMIVVSDAAADVKSVLRLLDKDGQSLAGSGSPLVGEKPDGAIAYGAAVELERLDQRSMLMPVLQHQEQAIYAFGRRDGQLFETLTMTAQSEQAAKQTTKVLEGLVAYEKLFAEGSESFTKLMDQVELKRSGVENSVDWQGETTLVVQAFEDIRERLGEWLKMIGS